MNKNTNPWMIATILLGGFILGFATAKFIPNLPEKSLEARAVINDVAQNTPNQAAAAQVEAALPAPLTADVYASVPQGKDANGNWTLGSKNAGVTIQEFSDFQCPFCHRYVTESFPEIFRNYIATGKIYYIYTNYPLSFHEHAPLAAQVALCAGDQNKYWEMHDALFQSQDTWSMDSGMGTKIDNTKFFEDLASNLKMDPTKLKQCLTSKKYADQVKKDTAVGDKNGVSGTPTFLINGNKVVGAQPYSVFKETLDNLLKK